MQPETHYTKAGDIAIAYQVLGEGPIDLVCVYGHQSNIQVDWTIRLASGRHGTGSSLVSRD